MESGEVWAAEGNKGISEEAVSCFTHSLSELTVRAPPEILIFWVVVFYCVCSPFSKSPTRRNKPSLIPEVESSGSLSVGGSCLCWSATPYCFCCFLWCKSFPFASSSGEQWPGGDEPLPPWTWSCAYSGKFSSSFSPAVLCFVPRSSLQPLSAKAKRMLLVF